SSPARRSTTTARARAARRSSASRASPSGSGTTSETRQVQGSGFRGFGLKNRRALGPACSSPNYFGLTNQIICGTLPPVATQGEHQAEDRAEGQIEKGSPGRPAARRARRRRPPPPRRLSADLLRVPHAARP